MWSIVRVRSKSEGTERRWLVRPRMYRRDLLYHRHLRCTEAVKGEQMAKHAQLDGDRLLKELTSECGYRDAAWILNAVSDPKWEHTGNVHDWRNYIPDAVRQQWGLLPRSAACIAVVMAEIVAGNEEWD